MALRCFFDRISAGAEKTVKRLGGLNAKWTYHLRAANFGIQTCLRRDIGMKTGFVALAR